ncbi:NAD(P)/FAD-dependent oxidoreductase [Nevskia sp.]|uniref:flavin-containing monooxygenase n=1 Tax=Nevskia sp. TaxID=1929292 RepID=UPI0025D8195A|nr:NAD(P)/FAD-dependent oxidoreductase [Nevskia sp.]
MSEIDDVLIIGAGLSGIGMACHLTRDCPGKKIAILERRQSIGGTWDLFRYPGIRSDSDMFSFGYAFRPWNALKVLADGPAIRQYVIDTAKEYGVDKKIRYGLKIVSADFSTANDLWTVQALDEASGEARVFTCRVLICCTGYYNYDKGFLPDFPGADSFKGQRIHPQHWPEGLDYKGKRVVVIGSGATAVTLVPAMAPDAAHVTMLQRSPSYIFSVPGEDKISGLLNRFLPSKWVHSLARTRNIKLQRVMYKAAKRYPNRIRKLLLGAVKQQLGDAVDMKHFTPSYKPWDERLCAVPNGDLFKTLKSGKASVVTDQIERFTETGIQLKSGQTLDADIIITATGLNIQIFGGVAVTVDGEARDSGNLMTYKGSLLQDVPNLGWIMGYTNASWTLKADLIARYICRVINHMDQHGQTRFVASAPDGEMQDDSILGSLGSGYIRRAQTTLPRQGRTLPWRVLHAYELDKPMLLEAPIEDAFLQFSAETPAKSTRKRKLSAAA